MAGMNTWEEREMEAQFEALSENVEFIHTDWGREMLKKMAKNPEDYAPASLLAELSRAGEEDRQGTKQWMCAWTVPDKTLFFRAPLIVMALFWGWQEALEQMLADGYVLRPDMELVIVAKSESTGYSFFSQDNEVHYQGHLSAVFLLMNQRIEKKLKEGCLKSMLVHRRDEQAAVITLDKLFYPKNFHDDLSMPADHEAVVLLHQAQKKCNPSFFDWAAQLDVLKENLLFAQEKTPELLRGEWCMRGEDAGGSFPEMHLLEIMPLLLAIYREDAQMRCRLFTAGRFFLGRGARNLMDHRLWGMGNFQQHWITFFELAILKAGKNGGKQLKEYILNIFSLMEQMKNSCVTQPEKESFAGFAAAFFLLLAVELQMTLSGKAAGRVKESFKQLVGEWKRYCGREDIKRCCQWLMELGPFGSEIGGYEYLFEAYRTVVGEKIELDLERSDVRHMVSLVLKGQVDEDGIFFFDEDASERVLELVGSFSYKETFERSKMMEEYFDKVLAKDNQELLRLCLKKGLFSRTFVERQLNKKAVAAKKRMVPLLVLAKHGVIAT